MSIKITWECVRCKITKVTEHVYTVRGILPGVEYPPAEFSGFWRDDPGPLVKLKGDEVFPCGLHCLECEEAVLEEESIKNPDAIWIG